MSRVALTVLSVCVLLIVGLLLFFHPGKGNVEKLSYSLPKGWTTSKNPEGGGGYQIRINSPELADPCPPPSACVGDKQPSQTFAIGVWEADNLSLDEWINKNEGYDNTPKPVTQYFYVTSFAGQPAECATGKTGTSLPGLPDVFFQNTNPVSEGCLVEWKGSIYWFNVYTTGAEADSTNLANIYKSLRFN